MSDILVNQEVRVGGRPLGKARRMHKVGEDPKLKPGLEEVRHRYPACDLLAELMKSSL